MARRRQAWVLALIAAAVHGLNTATTGTDEQQDGNHIVVPRIAPRVCALPVLGMRSHGQANPPFTTASQTALQAYSRILGAPSAKPEHDLLPSWCIGAVACARLQPSPTGQHSHDAALLERIAAWKEMRAHSPVLKTRKRWGTSFGRHDSGDTDGIHELTEEIDANATDTLPEFQAPPGQTWGPKGSLWRASVRRAAWLQLQERLAAPILGETFSAPLGSPVQLQLRLADDWGHLHRQACPTQQQPDDDNDHEEWGLDPEDEDNQTSSEPQTAPEVMPCNPAEQPVLRIPPTAPFHLFLLQHDGREQALTKLAFGTNHTFQATVGSAIRVRKGFTYPPVGVIVGKTSPVLTDSLGRSLDSQAASQGNWSRREITASGSSSWRGTVVWEALITGQPLEPLIIPHCSKPPTHERMSLLAGTKAFKDSNSEYSVRLNHRIKEQAATTTSWTTTKETDTFVGIAEPLSAMHSQMIIDAKLQTWRKCDSKGHVCSACGGTGILAQRPCPHKASHPTTQPLPTSEPEEQAPLRCQQKDAVPAGWLNATGVDSALPWLGHGAQSDQVSWTSDPDSFSFDADDECPVQKRLTETRHARECPVCGGTGVLSGKPEADDELVQPSQELCRHWGVQLQPLLIKGEFEAGISESQSLQCQGIGHESPLGAPGLIHLTAQDTPDSVWKRGAGELLAWDAEEALAKAMSMGAVSAKQAKHIGIGVWDVSTTVTLSVDEMLGGWERLIGLPSGQIIVVKVSQLMLPGQAVIVRGFGLPIPAGKQRSSVLGAGADVADGSVRLTGGLGNSSSQGGPAPFIVVLGPVSGEDKPCVFSPMSDGPPLQSIDCLVPFVNGSGIRWGCRIANSSLVIASQEAMLRYVELQRNPDLAFVEKLWVEHGVDARSTSWQEASRCKPSKEQPLVVDPVRVLADEGSGQIRGDVVLLVKVPALSDAVS